VPSDYETVKYDKEQLLIGNYSHHDQQIQKRNHITATVNVTRYFILFYNLYNYQIGFNFINFNVLISCFSSDCSIILVLPVLGKLVL
jgi:hypothetical protein